MAVFLTKDKNELYIDCNCRCGDGIQMKIDTFDDSEYYCLMTFTNGNFYRDQSDTIHRVIWRKLKKIWCIIRNKDYYYSDIIMNKDEFLEFKEFINNK